MADVSISGVGSERVTIPFSSAEQASLAQSLAFGIEKALQDGWLKPFDAIPDGAPSVGSGKSGEIIIHNSELYRVEGNEKAIVSDAAGPVILIGDNALNQTVIAAGSLTYLTEGGSGTIVSGAGNNDIITNARDGAGWLVSTGAGDDTVASLTGNDTISAGLGHNFVLLGTGSNLVDVSGSDTIQASSGNATVSVRDAGSAVVYGDGGELTFVGGAAASTVFGGTGAETIFGGSGTGLYSAGSGDASIFGGSGADTLVAGADESTLFGGGGSDVFEFVKGTGGGRDLIQDLSAGDTLKLSGFGATEATDALNAAQITGAGTTLKLSDGTTITLAHVTDKSSIHFG